MSSVIENAMNNLLNKKFTDDKTEELHEIMKTLSLYNNTNVFIGTKQNEYEHDFDKSVTYHIDLRVQSNIKKKIIYTNATPNEIDFMKRLKLFLYKKTQT
jgi:predicted secreted protein